ncbi:RNA polymerase sigma factor [Mesorhizobium sp. YR577]|uniref:RNA polymerase sigma factor n=1 Tax=Mesorhizobium sp. YR577 TaxID=1884373 RepID=UPI000B83CF07|nr:RNA polymerase sigma factor [Mesorhizobium sp. YR577]
MLWAGVDRLSLGKLIAAFVRVRPRLDAAAKARTGCSATAEDLMQDAWLKLENAGLEDGAIRNPAGFITRVAQHAVTDHLRNQRRRNEIDSELADILGENCDLVSPERTLIGRENLKAVRKILDELPEKTRNIFLMNRIDGISHRRLAELHGITDEAVYYHIRRALERLADLRDELSD